jgi:hypothetical protein
MLRLLSIAALASAAMIATIPTSPASAAALTINNVGPRIGAVNNAAGARGIASNTLMSSVQIPHQGPKAKKWVCGPIVNWDGTPHCHWVPTPTYP